MAAGTPPESSPSKATPPPPPSSSSENTEKWGTHVMGQPANPSEHPDNQKAATWNAAEHQQFHHQQSPYLVYSPVDKPTSNPLEPVIHFFNSWTTKADTIARNIWHNLKTGPSVTGAAWDKVNLNAKAITEGGFESMFKQIFSPSDPNEKLKKTFACYLSTSTGPVAGTIYLSTARIAFCSDRPLCFTAPSGQETWSYYKVNKIRFFNSHRSKNLFTIIWDSYFDYLFLIEQVVIPFGNVGSVNPVTMREKSSERYIQIVTVDGHDFWFMGFVNYEKASMHLMNSLSEFNAGVAAAGAV